MERRGILQKTALGYKPCRSATEYTEGTEEAGAGIHCLAHSAMAVKISNFSVLCVFRGALIKSFRQKKGVAKREGATPKYNHQRRMEEY
ncbi:hypothetical protein D6C00_10180 [Thiohalobacter thiocyanaticus]|uniref:Uncharacterized protein n=1 Tax=Thiohalobacter thiocyanaticus TaxID=585455 RepID=A0A426QKK3_9GAMM|nr:hypothetical protein D6C00_10180 [Thiohalobacter thiocyanaticus]